MAAVAHGDETGPVLEKRLAEILHELRTPLTTLRGYIDLMARKPGSDLAAGRLAVMRDQCLRIERLLEDVRGLASETGASPLRIGRVDARALLEAARGAAAPRFVAAEVDLEIEAPDGLATDCDRERVLEVLDNLLGNALRFAPAGSSVVLGAVDAGGAVVLSVDDAGPGVPEAEREHIFERGVTTGGGGSGLGLPVSRALAEAHGGALEVTGAPGGGARFLLTLPAAAP